MTIRHLPVIERLDHTALASLGPEWNELLAASSVTSPFLTWAWVSAWLDTLGSKADLEVHVARDADDGHLLGIAPFHVVATRRAGIPVRELRLIPGGSTAPDHLDLIVRASAGSPVAHALWAAVERSGRWDLLDLDGAAEGGHLDRLALRRDRDLPERIPVPYLPLVEDWDEVSARFSKSHRQNIGRYSRKLDAEAGAPVTERMIADHPDLDTTLDRLVEMHQAIRTSKGDRGLFADDETTRFLRTAAHRLLDAGRLRMWRLDVGDDAIAVIWCMRAFDTVAFYTTGFDAAWGKYGPGRRIMARAIQSAAAEGASEFDFLRGDEAYKQAWGTEIRYESRIRRPASTRGRMLWAARSAAHRIRRALPGVS